MCEQVLFVHIFMVTLPPFIKSMQFYYRTASNPGTRADDTFVLKHYM